MRKRCLLFSRAEFLSKQQREACLEAGMHGKNTQKQRSVFVIKVEVEINVKIGIAKSMQLSYI